MDECEKSLTVLQLKSSCKIVTFSTDGSPSGNMGETLVQISDDKRTKGVIPEIHTRVYMSGGKDRQVLQNTV